MEVAVGKGDSKAPVRERRASGHGPRVHRSRGKGSRKAQRPEEARELPSYLSTYRESRAPYVPFLKEGLRCEYTTILLWPGKRDTVTYSPILPNTLKGERTALGYSLTTSTVN